MLFARKKETKDNSGVMSVVYYAVVSRIATLALMIMANALLPTHNPSGVHLFRPTEYPVPAEPGVGGPLAPFTRWDSAWLLSIAEDDYPTASSSESRYIFTATFKLSVCLFLGFFKPPEG